MSAMIQRLRGTVVVDDLRVRNTAKVGDDTIQVGAETGTGDVSGPNSAVNGHLAVFSGTSGKLVADGGAVPPAGDVVGPSSVTGGSLAIYSGTSGKLLAELAVPSADPHVAGVIWNDAGTLKASAG